MIVIPPQQFTKMPWKNGGGVTHEIIKREENGKLIWRFSVADVTSDGPFSKFEGLSRILTVIEGGGLMLATGQSWIEALPFEPVAFSGDAPITSTRLNGNVQDFNVIFDPAAVSASVSMERGILELEADPEYLIQAVLLTGDAMVQHKLAKAGSFLLLKSDSARVESTAPMLRVALRTIKAR